MVGFNPGNTNPYYGQPAMGIPGGSANGYGMAPPASPFASYNMQSASGDQFDSHASITERISGLFKQPDATLDHISDLTPERLQQMGVKAVVFDMDDTLVPMGSGQVPPDAVQTLQRLQQAGIKVGVVSNNPSDSYTAKVQEQLAQQGIRIPFIKNATKPGTDELNAMMEHLGVSPSETAMVGDSRISDMMGGGMAGMKTIHANWYNAHGYHKAFAVIGDIGTSTWNSFKELFGSEKPPQIMDNPPAQA
jgi:HAD superfamily phosphatase (TIGR01668 family)